MLPLCWYLLTEPVDCRLSAAAAMRNLQRGQCHLDDAEGSEDHWRIHVPHMRDAERLPGEITNAGAQHNAALLIAVGAQRVGVITVGQHWRYGVAPFARLDDVEAEHLAFRPD